MRTALVTIVLTALLHAPVYVLSGEIHWDRWIDAVEQVESAGGHRLVGDDGRSLGHYQMSAKAWKDASKELGTKQGYKAHVFNKSVGQEHAVTFALQLYRQLYKALGREPTAGEVYCAYNMGFTGFKRTGFDLRKAPARTRRCADFIQSYAGTTR